MEKSSSEFTKPNLKNLQPEIKLYITHLEQENLRLQKQVAKLQVSYLSVTNKIKAMEKEITALTKKEGFSIVIYLPYDGSDKLPTHVETSDNTFIQIFYHEEA